MQNCLRQAEGAFIFNALAKAIAGFIRKNIRRQFPRGSRLEPSRRASTGNEGGPKGNKYALTYGLALVRNEFRRRTKRRRNYFDLRRHEREEALKVQAGLVEDAGE